MPTHQIPCFLVKDVCLVWQNAISAYDHCHNNLRIFDVLPNFPFPQKGTKRDY